MHTDDPTVMEGLFSKWNGWIFYRFCPKVKRMPKDSEA